MVAACLVAVIGVPGAAAQQPNPEPLWNAYPLGENQSAAGGSGSGGNAPKASTTPTPAAATTQVTVAERAGDGPPWVLMIVAAVGGALFVVVLLTLQGRRSRRRDEALVGVTDEWPWLTARPRADAHELRAARLRNGAAEHGPAGQPERAARETGSEWVADRDRVAGPEPATTGMAGAEREQSVERAGDEPAEPVAEAGRAVERGGDEVAEPVAEAGRAVERGGDEVAEPVAEARASAPVEDAARKQGAAKRPADNGAGGGEPAFDVAEAATVPRHRFDREGSEGRPVAARRGPICQVRWSGPGTCFYAVTTDAEGVEHRLAWSPPIEWHEEGPPDEDSREARAALRVLAKDLRDKGWKPMRAKGDDFDEPRWYARRFRFPVVEGDDDATPWLTAPAHRRD